MIGRILQATSKFTGTSTVVTEPLGSTVLDVDSVQDFALDAGFVTINGAVTPFTAVDRVNSTITITTPLAAELPAGSDIRQYPYSVQRWVYVETDESSVVSDAVWALLPHALAGFVKADGLRADDQRERIKYERDGVTFVVVDVIDRQPFINPRAIPPAAITETNISPGSITTPLLAANAVATENLQASAVQADNIDADALNGKVITGALVRSAATGRRVELSAAGLVQIDADGNVLNSLGDTNKFTGDFDATSLNIRQSLQLFGRDNIFAVGSKVTLKASTSSPTSAPTLYSDWEQSPLTFGDIGWTPRGMYAAADDADLHIAFAYGSFGKIRSGANFYQFPAPSGGGSGSSVTPYGYTRVKSSVTGSGAATRAVIVGEDRNALDSNGFPTIKVMVFNDSSMNSSGTVAPILYAEAVEGAFTYLSQWKLGRQFQQAGQTPTLTTNFVLAKLTQWRENSFYELRLKFFAFNDNVAPSVLSKTSEVTAPWTPLSENETLAGVSYGSSSKMGFAGPETLLLVVQTDQRNLVYKNVSGVFSRDTDREWPVQTATAQKVTFTIADVSGVSGTESTWGGFRSSDNSATTRAIYKYTDHNWLGTNDPFWVEYAWRGHTTKTFRSLPSYAAAVFLKKRSRLGISTPALPAPIAGVGAARDVEKDVYGWVIYIAQKSGAAPVNNQYFEQSAQPAGNPTTSNLFYFTTAPILSGNNPVLSPTFPLAQAAAIESDNGMLVIDGDGNVRAANANFSQLQVTGAATIASINGLFINDSGEVTPTLLNGWTQYIDTNHGPLTVCKINGIIYFSGLLIQPNAGSGSQPMFQLSPGWRPLKNRIVEVSTSGGRIRLRTYFDGFVVPVDAAPTGGGGGAWTAVVDSFPARN